MRMFIVALSTLVLVFMTFGCSSDSNLKDDPSLQSETDEIAANASPMAPATPTTQPTPPTSVENSGGLAPLRELVRGLKQTDIRLEYTHHQQHIDYVFGPSHNREFESTTTITLRSPTLWQIATTDNSSGNSYTLLVKPEGVYSCYSTEHECSVLSQLAVSFLYFLGEDDPTLVTWEDRNLDGSEVRCFSLDFGRPGDRVQEEVCFQNGIPVFIHYLYDFPRNWTDTGTLQLTNVARPAPEADFSLPYPTRDPDETVCDRNPGLC